ncbi:MAG: AMIN domain-containing protein [Sulfurimonas sp.]
MYRYFLILFILVSGSFARENPFFPIDSTDIPLTSNKYTQETPLKRASLKLPSTARTIESVTVSYKNLDGSIQQKTVELKNSIDWHLPIFVTQSYQTAKTKKSEPKKEVNFKEIGSLGFVKFKIDKNIFKIETKDKLLRSFLLVNPHRIVCDFKRVTDIRSYFKKVKGENVTQIKVGTHKDYYRVVVELDGSYRYDKTKDTDGYLFRLY